MTFNNIWLLFLIAPMILLLVAEIYRDGKDHIFPSAISRIKEHNYSRFNYGKHRLKFVLFVFGIFCLILSAAGPQFGTKVRKVERQGVDLVIAFDTSISMDAQDIKRA